VSELSIILRGVPFHGRACGQSRMIVPFIGVMRRDNGSIERGIGAKCPEEEERDPAFLFCRIVDSEDPLRYWRAFEMVARIQKITDSSLRDCATATKNECALLESLSGTDTFAYHGAYKRGVLSTAQKVVFALRPDAKTIQQIINGFLTYGAPLIEDEPEDSAKGPAPASSVIHLAQQRMLAPVPPGPAQKGHFYAGLNTISA